MATSYEDSLDYLIIYFVGVCMITKSHAFRLERLMVSLIYQRCKFVSPLIIDYANYCSIMLCILMVYPTDE